ncbi:MAG TPA: hypothetical protein VEA80_16030 [Vitreimonas sp.]|uniref:hypothetical protein n=1 Tax=Vitreimonas sp. TaxID=3069702 RepID=UPI002D6A1642|nr:hypothetical protein [Vitreimonas sp.]HYD88985.1 hypothetical protein [Vitreimonas sp.]
MKTEALRTWGIAVTAALMAAALAVTAQPAPPQRASAAAPAGGFEVAQAQPHAQPLAFLVRFRGSGPIARAQALAARGRVAAAQRQVEIQLRRQSDFAGLCFDRFTAGGAEIVLRTCAAIVASERASVQQRWLARLRAMRAVDYVDANATASRTAPG